MYQVDTTDVSACDGRNDVLCDWVYETTGNESLANVVDWFVERPLKVLLILAVAWIINYIARRAIRRAESRMVADRDKRLEERQAAEVDDGRFGDTEPRARQKAQQLALATEQSKQRARTLASVLSSIATAVIFTVAILMALGEFDIDLGPLIAGAGIAGIALGFGAQSLVKDFLSGFFMLAEDQFSVGDIVDVGDASGTVEAITLRTTRVRDINGTLWYIPNGEIRRVANKSQDWARAVLDIEVAYDTNIENASRVIKEVAEELWREHRPNATILEEPEILGVEQFGESAIVIRLAAKVEPGEQWATSRAIRQRLVEAFAREGIEIPFPQRVIWTRQDPAPEAE